MLRRVVSQKLTDVSEALTAPIITVMMNRPDDGGSKHFRNVGQFL
jgi:hypothetical protein